MHRSEDMELLSNAGIISLYIAIMKWKNNKVPIISVKIPEITSYLYHSTILTIKTCPEIWGKIWVDEVILRYMM